jgi:HAD superfamily hydrolase (TIGR01509 family)
LTSLLLDLGNVLVGVDPARALASLSRLAGLELADTATAFGLVADINDAFDRGEIDADGFRAQVCARLGVEAAAAELDTAWSAMLVELPQTKGLVAELAEHHALYMLSNTDPIHFAAVRARCAGWLDRFTGLHLSYETGLAKPDPAFFEAAIERFDLDRASCLFLDDRQQNVAAAEETGIPSKQVTGTGLDRDQLVAWGLLPVAGAERPQ